MKRWEFNRFKVFLKERVWIWSLRRILRRQSWRGSRAFEGGSRRRIRGGSGGR